MHSLGQHFIAMVLLLTRLRLAFSTNTHIDGNDLYSIYLVLPRHRRLSLSPGFYIYDCRFITLDTVCHSKNTIAKPVQFENNSSTRSFCSSHLTKAHPTKSHPHNHVRHNSIAPSTTSLLFPSYLPPRLYNSRSLFRYVPLTQSLPIYTVHSCFR